jgi:methylmalonyl-CoA mutase C-terminal domain
VFLFPTNAADRAEGPGAEEESLLRRYRVVIAKPGLDGHDRGAKVIARALRDAGFEVVYTGLFQTPGQVAEAVLQEDADALGLSVLSGAHMTLIPRVVDMLREAGLGDVIVFAGGIIPDPDRAPLSEMGVAQVFTPGASLQEVTQWLELALDERESAGVASGTTATTAQPDAER